MFISSCSQEDDLESIFTGKTWKITGATINGSSIVSDEIKELYSASESYQLYFTNTSFSGILASGSKIEGTWKADGGSRTINFHFNTVVGESSTPLSIKLYHVLQNLTSYTGDSHNLQLKQDKDNFVRLSVICSY